jgi:hypothetical protein
MLIIAAIPRQRRATIATRHLLSQPRVVQIRCRYTRMFTVGSWIFRHVLARLVQ